MLKKPLVDHLVFQLWLLTVGGDILIRLGTKHGTRKLILISLRVNLKQSFFTVEVPFH